MVIEFSKGLKGTKSIIELETVHQHLIISQNGSQIVLVLVKWKNNPLKEATWMNFTDFS